jgi:hypothetical protein
MKVAQRAKVKLSIKDYIERSKQTTKVRWSHVENGAYGVSYETQIECQSW